VQQGQYCELLVGKSHENQVFQMELDGLHVECSALKNCVINSANLMDLLHVKEERAARCDAAVNGLRRIIREVKELRTSANVELKVMATVTAGLKTMGSLEGAFGVSDFKT